MGRLAGDDDKKIREIFLIGCGSRECLRFRRGRRVLVPSSEFILVLKELRYFPLLIYISVPDMLYYLSHLA